MRAFPKICKRGVNIDGSSIAGMALINQSDINIFPDTSEYKRMTIEGFPCGFVWCTLRDAENREHPCCPRSILKKVLRWYEEAGYFPEQFGELEFYLFEKGTCNPQDNATYLSVPPEDKGLPYRLTLARMLDHEGIEIRRIHHECGPGQNEVEMEFAPALVNSDNLQKTMWLARMLADKMGLECDVMPKPNLNLAGNGLHQHTMIFDSQHRNLFSDGNAGLSDVAKHFIAGLLHYARDITAVFAMGHQSFARLDPRHEAPLFIAWGLGNRSALVRVPVITQANQEMTRIEFRGGDASGAPHLLNAMILAAGLRGIQDQLECPLGCDLNFGHLTEEQRGQFSMLPQSISETIEILRTSQLCRDVLGREAVEFLIHHKEEML